MTSPGFSTRGVVDLGALRPSASRPSSATGANGASGPAVTTGVGQVSAPPAPASAGSYVLDAGEADLQQLLDQSMSVPVVLDFWAEWCGPCKQLSPVLERLAVADGGRWLLAKVDVDANQRLGAAFQVQSIPAVFALVAGRALPLFQGALPEAQVRQYVDELLRLAESNGVTGRVDGASAADGGPSPTPLTPPVPSGVAAALAAIDAGDLGAAAEAYRGVLRDAPADETARRGLAQVELVRRAGERQPQEALQDAARRPSDVDAQLAAADVELLSGYADQAFSRLIALVRGTGGPDRERVRQHLIELFEVLGAEDARVLTARRDLTSALF